MRHTLHIQLRLAEGAILRSLGLIERRGFRLETVHAEEGQGDGQALEVTVSGDRSPDLLRRQLERLHDVIWVETKERDADAASGWTKGTQGAGRPLARRD